MSHAPHLLQSVKEQEENVVSPLSAKSLSEYKRSSRSLNNDSKLGSYEPINVDEGEDITSNLHEDHVGQSSRVSPADSLGIFPGMKASTSSIRRVPVGSKTPRVPSPVTSDSSPASTQNLLDSPDNPSATPSKKRFMWETPPRLNNLFEKIRPRTKTPHREVRTQNAASPSASNSLETESLEPTHKDSSQSFDEDVERVMDGFDDEVFNKKFGEPPSYCWSKKDIHQKRNSWIAMTIIVLSVYSTVMSSIWLIVSIIQPRWNHVLSSKGSIPPSTATLLTALFAKTIELSFVTVFISCLGQVLTRRSFVRGSKGLTIAEMTMRNWVIQPGSLITHCETLPYAGLSILGALTLTASIAAMFYTTASDAMVAPKLKYDNWNSKELAGGFASSYANVGYIKANCPDMLGLPASTDDNLDACLSIQFSGQSYRNLMSFMSTWTSLRQNGTLPTGLLTDRPTGTNLLYDNTTMTAAWIETEHGNVTASFEKYGRIINNVTMAMPHPGVYAAARLPVNEIMQPDELSGVGEYSIRAGVVSPAINVMCVNMNTDELAPLIYTTWPNSDTKPTGVGKQSTGGVDWKANVPSMFTADGKPEFLNRTVVDDIFHWGPTYKRRPPVFSLYPNDLNIVANSTVYESDSIYVLAKSNAMDNYTLCQMRSWVSPLCSTQFNISGTSGISMMAHCEDPHDRDAYHRSFWPDQEWPAPATDWKWVGDIWQLSMNVNGGFRNDNASNARVLAQLALTQPQLVPYTPSMAEALAAYAGSTLVLGSINTPPRHYWEYAVPGNQLKEEAVQYFNSSLTTQRYTSGHISDWQNIFYIVLTLVFILNICCLGYLIFRSGLVTDFTEPQNLFALAVNSPPTAQLKGSCGGGPRKRDLVVPWRVAYAPSANHYFFEEANGQPWRGKYAGEGVTTARPAVDRRGSSYKRLSSGRGWL